jgi:hypothetical protein
MRAKARGSLAGCPIKIKKALMVLEKYSLPIPAPGPSDWLAEHDEDGQMYDNYITSKYN